MNCRARTLTSVMAMATLLAFVCLSWMTPEPAEAASEVDASKNHHVFHAGPVSPVRCLAETKPRIPSVGAAALASLVARMSVSSRVANIDYFVVQPARAQSNARPLWLVNRALLI